MQLKTILNRVQKFKSFVYGAVRWNDATSPPSLEVELRPRVNGWALCSGCGRRRAGYDRLPLRRFEIVPLWGMKVFWLYAPRRVDCPGCGVKVEHVALGRRETPLDDGLCVVSGGMGQAAVLERGGRGLPHELGCGVRGGGDGRGVGSGARRPVGDSVARHRRDCVGTGASLPDLGLSDRYQLQANPVGR